MAGNSSGVGEGTLADKEVEVAGVQSSEREIDRHQQSGRRLSNPREIPICSFSVWQTWCQVLNVYRVLYFTAIPEVETLVSMLETGRSVQ